MKKQKSSAKKPAKYSFCATIAKMITSRFEELNKGLSAIGSIRYAGLHGEIRTLLEVLEREKINISQKQRKEIAHKLSQIKLSVPAESIQIILSEWLSKFVV